MERKEYSYTVERERPSKDIRFKHVKTNVRLEVSTLEELRAVLGLYGFEPKNMNQSFAKNLSARGLNEKQHEVFNSCPIDTSLYNYHSRKIAKNGYSEVRGSKMKAINDFLLKYRDNTQAGHKLHPKVSRRMPKCLTTTMKTIPKEAVASYYEKIQNFEGWFWAKIFGIKDIAHITEKLKIATAENTDLVVINLWYERLQIIYNYNPETNE